MKSSLTDKSVLITGANGGIGLATWQQVATHNPERLTLACRGAQQAQDCKQQVSPNLPATTEIEALAGFEMTDARQLKKSVAKLPEDQPFDVVFVQVGGVFFDKDYDFITTPGGRIEKTIFQNAIGGYLLIQYLLERNLLSKDARIVFCGGEGARGVKPLIAKTSFHSIEKLQNYIEQGDNRPYNTFNAIGISKLVSALISLKLAEIDKQREYVWFSPGLTSGTQGLDHKPGISKYISKGIIFPLVTALGLAQTPKAAAKKCLNALTGEIGQSGDLIGAPEGKALGKLCDQKPMNPDFTNQQLRNKLFNFLENTFGPFAGR